MIQVEFTEEFGTYSAGDVRSYDEVSAARLIEAGHAKAVDAPVEKKPKRSAVAETVTVAEPS